MTTLTGDNHRSRPSRKKSADNRERLEKLIRDSGLKPVGSIEELYAKSDCADQSEEARRAEVDDFLAMLEEIRRV